MQIVNLRNRQPGNHSGRDRFSSNVRRFNLSHYYDDTKIKVKSSDKVIITKIIESFNHLGVCQAFIPYPKDIKSRKHGGEMYWRLVNWGTSCDICHKYGSELNRLSGNSVQLILSHMPVQFLDHLVNLGCDVRGVMPDDDTEVRYLNGRIWENKKEINRIELSKWIAEIERKSPSILQFIKPWYRIRSGTTAAFETGN